MECFSNITYCGRYIYVCRIPLSVECQFGDNVTQIYSATHYSKELYMVSVNYTI